MLTKKNVDDGFKKLFAATIEELTEKDGSDLADDFVYINDFVSEMLSETLNDEKFKKLLIFLHENVKIDLDKMNIDIENIAKKLETGLSNINASLKVETKLEQMYKNRLMEIYKQSEDFDGDLENFVDDVENENVKHNLNEAIAHFSEANESLEKVVDALGLKKETSIKAADDDIRIPVAYLLHITKDLIKRNPDDDVDKIREAIIETIMEDFDAQVDIEQLKEEITSSLNPKGKEAPTTTCKNCGRGAYEGVYDGEDTIICSNCGKPEDDCKCEPVKQAGCGGDTEEEKKFKAIQKNKEKSKKKKKTAVEVPEIKEGTRDELLKVEAVLKERMPGITKIDLGRAMREIITAAKKNITDPKILQRLRTAEINNMFPEFDQTGGVWKVEKDENGKETIIRPDIKDIESVIMNKGCVHKVGDALTLDLGGEKGKMIEVQIKELLDGGKYKVKAFTNGKEYETDDAHLFTQDKLEEQYG